MNDTTLDTGHADFIICHECDLLVQRPSPGRAPAYKCPRCFSPITEHASGGLAKPMAAVVAGLLFFWPANFLPILRLSILGIESTHTMVGAVQVIADSGMLLVASMVLFCSVLAPFFELMLLALVLPQVAMGRNVAALPALFRFYTRLDSWAMLEVYMIGLLVSVIKLIGMASVRPGVGLICFVGMMATGIATKLTLDHHLIWERIESICRP